MAKSVLRRLATRVFVRVARPVLVAALFLVSELPHGLITMVARRRGTIVEAEHFARLAMEEADGGHWRSALQYARLALASAEDFPLAHLAHARALALKGDRDGALAACEKAMRTVSLDPLTLVALGDIQAELDSPSDAERSYRAVLAADPENRAAVYQTAVYRLADLLVRHGRAAEAVAFLEDRARGAPGSAEWIGPSLGYVLLASGDFAKATTVLGA